MKKIYFLILALFAFSNMHAQIEGTWVLAPEATALAVGPAQGDFSWWSNSAADVDTRACLFDDKFVFNEDGTFQNIQDGETWLEPWQGVDPEACGAPVAPHDGSNEAAWSYNEDMGMLTLTGTGAHLGLAKVINGGELASPAAAPASISYPVVLEGDDRMVIDIDFGGGFWHFVLVRAVEEPNPLEGTTWKLAPEATALAVGPAQGDFSWWSNSAADVDTRACLFDDKFIFNEDGTFQNIQDGETWLEPWQGVDPEACGAPVAPHDGSNEATWSYDKSAGTLTITGVGAHIGLAKVVNGGELASPATAPASITYPVVFEGDDNDRMVVDINFGPGYWHFVFVKDVEEMEEEEMEFTFEGTWKVATEAQALAVGPALGDYSWWSNNAADVDTRACFFDDQYVFGADGTFQNVQDGETWLEPWQGVDPEACGAPIAPHDGSNEATWSYNEETKELTITGTGAYLGLAKVINGGELASPATAPASVTYPVVMDGNNRMIIDINFGPGYWHFVLEKDLTTSTVEIAKEDLFRFFPNPANANIQIQSDKALDYIKIRDISGRTLLMQTKPRPNETIDVSRLNAGLYIIEARSGNKISVEKLSVY